jgi:maltooligosyltrehalose trehalohydrolase
MRRAHRMPFGAEVHADATRFRLWAPAAARVDIVIGAAGRHHPMDACGDGWYEATLDDAVAGTRYAFRIDDGLTVPDPASRANPDGVHASSAVVDPLAYAWHDDGWRGRPWEDAVIYELHIGTFTPDGTFAAAAERLAYLVDLGVTAIELMPVAAFPGRRDWGYDGVLPFAPATPYGTPDALKSLVDAAHAHGIIVLLDVVYNHFGPEGNYLHLYAPQFFNARHRTAWGDALNFDGEASRTVRDFFVHNALYWLEEFRFDGLRLDAVHAIADDSRPDIVTEIAQSIRERFDGERDVHLVLENDRNDAHYLRRDAAMRPLLATAQWNDDLHHALHVIATGESDGYYADYAARPVATFGRALAEGFVFQGEASAYRGGARRGAPSAALPPSAFVSFAQNHDQIGNRALGERLDAIADARALRALTACLLLAPAPPMLFMGEEFTASTPFLFFCDFGPGLADAVTRGRRNEFARFHRFADRSAQDAIPDPNREATFIASKLDWRESTAPRGSDARAFHRHCLAQRRTRIVAFARDIASGGVFDVNDERLLRVTWTARNGDRLHLVANLSPQSFAGVGFPPGECVYASDGARCVPGVTEELPAWAVAFILDCAA